MSVQEVKFIVVVVGMLTAPLVFLYCIWYLGESSLNSFRAAKIASLNPPTKIDQCLNKSKAKKAEYEGNITRVSFKNVNRFPNEVGNQGNHDNYCQKSHNFNPVVITHISFLSNLCIRVYRLLRKESTTTH